MKKIGILGSMAWPSTLDYYATINRYVNQRLGGSHSARVTISGEDFALVEQLQREDKWDKLAILLFKMVDDDLLTADFLVIASNTMHKVAERLQELTGKPVLHIADAVAEEIKAQRLNKVILLGTRKTMESDFYKAKLHEHGITTLIPDAPARDYLDHIIFDELVNGKVSGRSKCAVRAIIDDLNDKHGYHGVVLGCTELPIFWPNQEQHNHLPLFKTAEIHARAAAKLALAE